MWSRFANEPNFGVMTDHYLEHKLARLREQLDRGEYAVDPDAVAEALLQRLRLRAVARDEIARLPERTWPYLVQNACSNPDSPSADPPASSNSTPVPSLTRPIHVIRPVRSLFAASSIAFRAPAGAQTQSS